MDETPVVLFLLQLGSPAANSYVRTGYARFALGMSNWFQSLQGFAGTSGSDFPVTEMIQARCWLSIAAWLTAVDEAYCSSSQNGSTALLLEIAKLPCVFSSSPCFPILMQLVQRNECCHSTPCTGVKERESR